MTVLLPTAMALLIFPSGVTTENSLLRQTPPWFLTAFLTDCSICFGSSEEPNSASCIVFPVLYTANADPPTTVSHNVPIPIPAPPAVPIFFIIPNLGYVSSCFIFLCL